MDPDQLLEALEAEDTTVYYRFGNANVFYDAESSGHHDYVDYYRLIVSEYANGESVIDYLQPHMPDREVCQEDPDLAVCLLLQELQEEGLVCPHEGMKNVWVMGCGGVCCETFPNTTYDGATHLVVFTGECVDFPIEDGLYVVPEKVLAIFEVGSIEYEYFMTLYME